MIGSLGDTVFEVTPDVVRTIRDATRSAGSRWNEHAVHLAKPVSEFEGPDLDEVSLSVRLDVELGTEPMDEAIRLREACADGEVLPLILGETLIGDFSVRRVQETWRQILPSGRIGKADVTVELREYA